ncbi:type IX secretion system protein PorD [Flavitalea flava]
MRKIYLMIRGYLLGMLFLGIGVSSLQAQDLQANITVLADRVPATTDRKIFQTLQSALNNFLNNRKWANESFQTNERIACNFLLNISSAGDNNTFTATLTVQAGRPVFNSTYQSPLINFNDGSFSFRYVEFQPLDFNESRVQGSEPFAANLTAEFAYYIYIILGLNFDSYSLRGGDPYFQKALNIVNNAPDSRDISGWKAFDGIRNRYWLIENLTNSKYTLIHDAFYSYYRSGLDQMYDKEADGRTSVLNALNMLNTINTETPNTMIMQFFFQGKSGELAKIFQKSPPDEKSRALDLLTKLDISNISKYKQSLQ